MKIITEPEIHILSLPNYIPHEKYVVPAYQRDEEAIIAHAGKGCYDSYGKDGRSIRDHINSLISSYHGSVLEHVNVGFWIEGISRGCSHEIVRHRHFAYSQRSTRYTKEDDAAIVLDPFYTNLYYRMNNSPMYSNHTVTDEEKVLVEKFITSAENSIEAYKDQVARLLGGMVPVHIKELGAVAARKWARGKARQLLPHALETRMTMTGNLRAWRHFIEERTSEAAEPEIRRLADYIADALSFIAPHVFGESQYEVIAHDDGTSTWIPTYRKV